MASRRKAKCKLFDKRCNSYSTKDLSSRFDQCLSLKEAKKIRRSFASRDKSISKTDYCRHIKLSPGYERIDPSRVTVAGFKKIARLNSRKKYNPKIGILSPLVYPHHRIVKETPGGQYFSELSIMSLAQQFKNIATIYLPKTTEENSKNVKGIIYRAKNKFAASDISAAEGDKDTEALIIASSSKITIDYPTDFWTQLKASKKRFFICFIFVSANRIRDGKEYMSRHSNVLILDKRIGEMERFEPLGYITYPKYEYQIFDTDLEKKLGEHGITYISPIEWEPKLGLQKHEIIQSEALDVEDPVPWSKGFCSFWTYIWTFLRLNNPKLSREELFQETVTSLRLIPTSILTFVGNLVGALVWDNYEKALEMGWDPEKISFYKWLTTPRVYAKLRKAYGLN